MEIKNWKEYPKVQEVKEKLDKCKNISNDKKAIYKSIEENKDKIIKELKEVYNINLVKIVKDSYYEKYKFAENEMNNGLIEIYCNNIKKSGLIYIY